MTLEPHEIALVAETLPPEQRELWQQATSFLAYHDPTHRDMGIRLHRATRHLENLARIAHDLIVAARLSEAHMRAEINELPVLGLHFQDETP